MYNIILAYAMSSESWGFRKSDCNEVAYEKPIFYRIVTGYTLQCSNKPMTGLLLYMFEPVTSL